MRQAQTVRDAAAELDVIVSGGPAADLLAPWRVARHAVVYARTGLDLARLGFSETTRVNAALEYVVPADPTIWSTGRAWSSPVSGCTADPALVAWAVQRTGGPDAADAALADVAEITNRIEDVRIVGGHMASLLLAAFPVDGALLRRTADADLTPFQAQTCILC